MKEGFKESRKGFRREGEEGWREKGGSRTGRPSKYL
jgi:hypothetical protein